MSALDRLRLAIAAMDAENGCNRWWQRVYGLPDRTTPGDVWIYLQGTGQWITSKRQKRKAAA